MKLQQKKPLVLKQRQRLNMTCRGYDSKAVKVPKEVKRRAATILDDHQRGSFIRSWAEIYREGMRAKIGRKSKD